MIWGIFIGISIATRQKAHLGIDIFVSLAPPKGRRALEMLSAVLLVVTYLVMLVLSTRYVLMAMSTGNTSPILRIPYWIIYMAMPLGFFLSTIRALQVLFGETTGHTSTPQEVLL